MALLLLLLPHIFLSSLAPHYLSPSGSDTYDGTSPSHTPGTSTGPWLTLHHGVTALREVRPATPGPEDMATLLLLDGTYHLTETLTLDARDAHLELAAYSSDPVTISGGKELDLTWEEDQHGVRTATVVGTCAEVFLDTWRLLPARSPNIPWGPNSFIAKGSFHTITGLLEETATCTRDATGYAQDCPDSDRDGFVISGELDPAWPHLDQTKVVVFHSWIAEYAKVANVTMVEGRQEVSLQEPLIHAPVGNFITSGGWRFLVINNRAVLDMEGEVVCVQEGQEATISYIPPTGLEAATPVLAELGVLIGASNTHHITLTGLQFQHSSSLAKDGYSWGSEAAVKFWRTDDVTVQHCGFSHIGTIGLYMESCHGVTVHHNTFWDVGYHGLMARCHAHLPSCRLTTPTYTGPTKGSLPMKMWLLIATHLTAVG